MSSTEFTREQLLAANEDAAAFYRRHLFGPDGEGPRRYLIERGFEALLDDTPWTVGHAPAGWTTLHDHLSELGYSDECQLAAGLTTISRHANPIDRFRDRITFGIRNASGDLIGFTARNAPDRSGPKYLNTPKTDLFDKSSELFGLGEAASSSAATHVVVEGPLDAIAVYLATHGELAPLAMCGTALTGHHAYTIHALEPGELILAFDGDAPGDRALETAAATFGAETLAIRLTRGDPASVLEAEGPQRLSREVALARPAVQVLLDLYLERWPDRLENAEASIGCLRECACMINLVSPADVASIVTRLENETKLGTETVTFEIVQALERTPRSRGLRVLNHRRLANTRTAREMSTAKPNSLSLLP